MIHQKSWPTNGSQLSLGNTGQECFFRGLIVCAVPISTGIVAVSFSRDDKLQFSAIQSNLSPLMVMQWADAGYAASHCEFLAAEGLLKIKGYLPQTSELLWVNTEVNPVIFNGAYSQESIQKACSLILTCARTGRPALYPKHYPVAHPKARENFSHYPGESHCSPKGAIQICPTSLGDINLSSLGVSQTAQEGG